jgi:hypothetical protein
MNEDQDSVASTGFLQEIFHAPEDASRCFGSLAKLARHLDEPVVITGSIAAGWHLLNRGRQPEKRCLNDIDTVAVAGLSHVRPSLSQDFLINHFHPYRERGKVLLQLVDEEHGTRTEVFTPGSDSLAERLLDCAVGDLPCRIVSAEDGSAKLLSIIHSVIEGQPVDPKYVEQFDALSAVADRPVTRKVWREYRKENQSLDFDEAAAAVKSRIAANPNLLQATFYCQDVGLTCAWCQESELFPIASRPRVYEILGYV